MTKKKIHLKDVIPIMVKKHHTFSPSALIQAILTEYNKDFSLAAFTLFFQRNPDILKQLETEVTAEDIQQIEVSDNIFQNGAFEQLPSIKKWNIEKTTLVSPKYQRTHVNQIKLICQGIYYTRDKTNHQFIEHHIPNWTLKSPERLTLEQFLEFIAEVQKAGCCTNTYRMAFRDFWLSRTNQTLKPSQVSGLMTTGTTHKLGRWKNVFVPKDTLKKILEYIKERDFIAYAADFTMFKTGCRSKATLTEFLHAKLRNEDGIYILTVTDKGFHRSGRQPFDKIIMSDLLEVLNICWEKNGENAFAGLNSQYLRNLNKEAYKIFLADDIDRDGTVKQESALELGLASPNHFWRHMFGSHMLRATGYNYTAVAELGSWKTEDMLKKVYGAPPKEMLRKIGLETIPTI